MGSSESKTDDQEMLEEYLATNADYHGYNSPTLSPTIDRMSNDSDLMPGLTSWCDVARGTIIRDLLTDTQAGKSSSIESIMF